MKDYPITLEVFSDCKWIDSGHWFTDLNEAQQFASAECGVLYRFNNTESGAITYANETPFNI